MPIPNPKGGAPPAAVRDRLADIYGDNYAEEIDSRSDADIVDLAEHLTFGVPMGTPVFDGAREADVSAMLATRRARYFGSGRPV